MLEVSEIHVRFKHNGMLGLLFVLSNKKMGDCCPHMEVQPQDGMDLLKALGFKMHTAQSVKHGPWVDWNHSQVWRRNV